MMCSLFNFSLLSPMARFDLQSVTDIIIIIIIITNEKIKVMLSRKTLQGHFTRL